MSRSNRPIITDPNTPVPGTTMEQRLEKYKEEKQEYSRIREEELLNSYSLIDDVINCIDRIRSIFSKQKTK